MSKKYFQTITTFLFLFFQVFTGVGQITAPGAEAADRTYYPSYPEVDSIFIFCAVDTTTSAASLNASTAWSGTKTFLWERYDEQAGDFEFFFSESTDEASSQIDNLTDGGYRVSITQGENVEVFRAWVFNNWMFSEAYVSDSDCESLTLNADFRSPVLSYFDLTDNTPLEVVKNIQVEWKEAGAKISSTTKTQIYSPPTKDTEYEFHVSDKFGCASTSPVLYESIVTQAAFSVNPGNGEAPLEVIFNNESENGDPGLFEWFFFRDLDEIKRESEESGQPVDSIMVIAYDDNPVYTYEYSGTYNVKLVSKKVSEFHTCVDTVYIEDYIVVDTSFITVPNVFTPNGDGTNDEFIVQFWSMQNIKISIFNRWGKRIHSYKSDDVRGFEGTYTETVWDGRVSGGRFATPGVYFYTVVGEGRDGKNRRAHGFFHLFRGKD